jgi:hypothetical protein
MTAVERIRRFDSADAQWLRKKRGLKDPAKCFQILWCFYCLLCVGKVRYLRTSLAFLSSAVLLFGVPIDIGPKGPKMTWAQRAKAGIPAEKFQAALAAESKA